MTTYVDDGRPGALTDQVRTCPNCQAAMAMLARFCPACGTAQGRHETHDTLAQPALAGEAPRRGIRPPARILIAAGLGLALAVGGAVAWATADSAADKQAHHAGAVLAGAFDQLVSAQTTADIRKVATSVAAPASEAQGFIEKLPAADRDPELVELTAAITALADLEDVSGETPDVWDDAEAAIRDLDEPQVHDAALGTAAVAAADRVDEVMDKATEAYEEWAVENRAAVAARDAAIADATTYQTQMSGYLDQYADLRRELSDYIEIVDTQGSTIDEGYRQFSEASQARRVLRDQMTRLTPPEAAAGEHDRLLAIIDDGIAGVEAAERGLDERECTYYGCTVSEQPAWQHFRSESQRISSALADAVSAWQAAAQAAIDEAQAAELPDKPQL